uniref:Uncharacterized protein n=1 Tax=Knipowitschia caucasica TaxID=637954 RepID=A0AAV2JFM6_KNICA
MTHDEEELRSLHTISFIKSHPGSVPHSAAAASSPPYCAVVPPPPGLTSASPLLPTPWTPLYPPSASLPLVSPLPHLRIPPLGLISASLPLASPLSPPGLTSASRVSWVRPHSHLLRVEVMVKVEACAETDSFCSIPRHILVRKGPLCWGRAEADIKLRSWDRPTLRRLSHQTGRFWPTLHHENTPSPAGEMRRHGFTPTLHIIERLRRGGGPAFNAAHRRGTGAQPIYHASSKSLDNQNSGICAGNCFLTSAIRG